MVVVVAVVVVVRMMIVILVFMYAAFRGNNFRDTTAVYSGAAACSSIPSRIIERHIASTHTSLTSFAQQSAADGSSSSSAACAGIEAEVSFLRCLLRVPSSCTLPSASPPCSIRNDDAARSRSHDNPQTAPALPCASHRPVAGALASSAASGKRERQTGEAIGRVAAGGDDDEYDGDDAAVAAGSGGQGLQTHWRSWCARVTRALQRLLLLGLWQQLRRVATSFLQPMRRAIIRIAHAVGRGGGGSGTVRRQQMVLVLASIVMMVLYGQSDRL